MKLIRVSLPALGLALLLAAPALAQEAIQTANGAAQAPPGAPKSDTDSDDAWAKRTLDAATAKPDAKSGPRTPASAACAATQSADNMPHGEVWAGIGTRGYREVGGVVTQPLGACGTLTLGVDHIQSDGYRPGRPR